MTALHRMWFGVPVAQHVTLLPDTQQAVVLLINANTELPFNEVNAVMSRLPIGVVNLLRGQPVPQGPSLRRAYFPFNAAAALVVIGLLALAWRAARARRARWSVGLLLIAIVMVLALHAIGLNAAILFAFAPDLALVLAAALALLCMPSALLARLGLGQGRPFIRRHPPTATMKHKPLWVVLAIVIAFVLVAALVIRSRFEADLAVACSRAPRKAALIVATRCGPIEVQQAGDGMPLLVVHGSGGGHDQGMAWARPLAQQGIRVIAMSRFGYLRTPLPGRRLARGAGRCACLPARRAGHRQGRRDGRLGGRPVGAADGDPPPGPRQRAGARGTDRLQARRRWPTPRHPCRTTRTRCCCACSARTSCSGPRCTSRAISSSVRCWPRRPSRWPRGQRAGARARERRWPSASCRCRRARPGLRDDTRLGKRLRPLRAGDDPRADARGQRARRRLRHLRGARSTPPAASLAAKFVGFDHGGHLLVGHDAAVRSEVVRLLSDSR